MSDIMWIGGIPVHTDEINDVRKTCQYALDEAGYRDTALDKGIENYLRNMSMDNFLDDPTDAIITAALDTTRCLLEEKFKEIGLEEDVSYYANGSASYLHVGGQTYHDDDGIIKDMIELAEAVNETELDVVCWDYTENGKNDLYIELSMNEEGYMRLGDVAEADEMFEDIGGAETIYALADSGNLRLSFVMKAATDEKSYLLETLNDTGQVTGRAEEYFEPRTDFGKLVDKITETYIDSWKAELSVLKEKSDIQRD